MFRVMIIYRVILQNWFINVWINESQEGQAAMNDNASMIKYKLIA